MAYETRRQRRLRAEEAKRKQRQYRDRRWLFVLAVAFVLLAMFIGARFGTNKKTDLSSSSQKTTQISSQSIKTASQKITENLPSQVATFNSQLGLPKVVNTNDLPGKADTSVVVLDVSGKNRGNVNYNGDTQFTSASTYKIYVAYAMIHDVETGRRNWGSSINGTTWEACLSRMIINSDNACPETYVNSIGYTKFNSIVQSLGVSDKTVFAPYDMRTTANDLALVLQKIYKGELMSQENKDRLISLMSQQVYREGIPAGIGSSGTVADKVGFLDALLHDAGIIYSDKGDYIMVIMTNGESWGYIAKIASYINGVMSE